MRRRAEGGAVTQAPGGGGHGGRPDRYGRFVASETYRRGRVRKAGVIWHLCRDRLTAGGTVVDLGAGTGIIRAELERRAERPIWGFEIDEAFIVEGDRMVRADVLRLPLASGSVRFAMLNHLYEHVEDAGRLFEEVWRILAPGGTAYVSAGNRLAVLEPHYRLPFLSWLPRGLADLYLRLAGRGRSYDDIRFLTYRPLRRRMRAPGFFVRDITEAAIDGLIERAWGAGWARLWRGVRRLPRSVRVSLLRTLSPQWFFLLEKPARPAGPEEGVGANGEEGRRP